MSTKTFLGFFFKEGCSDAGLISGASLITGEILIMGVSLVTDESLITCVSLVTSVSLVTGWDWDGARAGTWPHTRHCFIDVC